MGVMATVASAVVYHPSRTPATEAIFGEVMASAADYVRILEELGIDTNQLWPRLDHTGRILRTRSGERYSGLYFNHHGGICYFTVNPRVATVNIDWKLWQEVPPTIAVPHYDHDKHNIVPRPGQERRALRTLLSLPANRGFLNSLRKPFGRSS